MDTRKWFILILLVTLAAAAVVVPVGKKPGFLKDIKITPGIDLAGGADLTYQILYKDDAEKKDPQKRPDAIKDVLKRRINQRGLKEPRITTLDDNKIVIQLAVQRPEELNEYKNLLEQVGKLELRSVASAQIHKAWLDTPGTKEGKWKENEPAGWDAIENNEKMGGEYDYLGHEYLLVSEQPIITGADVKNATPSQTIAEGSGGWKVHFELTDEGGKRFDQAAKELYKQSPKGAIAIVMDGVIKSKPTIRAEKFGGSGEITGKFSKTEAENLAVILRSGQLPVAIGNGKREPGKPESENFIGPTLAQDSLRRGVIASILAAALVAIFMTFYYRGGGLIAVFTLVCNITYLLAVMAIFGATMTLPGLAGLALTITMAVDNNILILERVREEMEKGKTALQAFEAGHSRAFSAIFDGNITTLLAAGVLYYFGTDAVQGFATVLAIGLLSTMISVLVVGKMAMKLLIQAGTIREFKMLKLWRNINVDWIRKMPAAGAFAVLLTIGSAAVFWMRFQQCLGMDFKGGLRVIFNLQEERSIEHVRSKLAAIKAADGTELYPDIEVTTQSTEAGAGATKVQIFAKTTSKSFQVRTSDQDLERLKEKIQEVFQGEISHDPWDEPVFREDPNEKKFIVTEGEEHKEHPVGGWFHLYVKKDGYDEALIAKTIEEIGTKAALSMDKEGATPKVNVRVREVAGPPGLVKLRVMFAKPDMKQEGGKEPERFISFRKFLKEEVEKGALQGRLPESPFVAPGRIGPTAAGDLRDSTIWAMIIAWALMIVYIAIRFSSWKFGVSAVIALVFDSIVPIGVIALLGWVVPKGLGLSFEMNVTTVAALLTIIGYAINDTVVVFDRIRENLVLMKKETFAEIINASINQTMSRTILTGISVLGTCVILYVFSMTSAGGVAEFALPLFFGVLCGTYASIFIATQLVLRLTGGQKPQVAK